MTTPPPLPSVPPPMPAPAPPPKKPRSWLWLWILLPLLLCGGGLGGFYAVWNAMVKTVEERTDRRANLSPVSLPVARKAHPTVLTAPADKPGEPPETPPAAGPFDLIKYPAPLGENAAYLTRDPGDGKKHPAIVWAKGGFGGIGDFLWQPAPRRNDQSVNAFLKAGLAVLCPSWRGENGNPGRFESFFGEVDDLLAAVRYAKTVAWIDPERVYLAGHSTGGTVVLLAAVSSDEFRAAFSFGGVPDMEAATSDGKGFGNTAYDIADKAENELRSPIRFTAFLKRPTFYFEGGDSPYPSHAARMQRIARRKKVPFQAFEIKDGTHFDILAPLTRMVAEKIRADTGPLCGISVTGNDIRAAIAAMPMPVLSDALTRWTTAGGSLQDALLPFGGVYDKATPQSLRAVVDAARHAIQRDDATTDADLAELIGVWQQLQPPDEKSPLAILWRTGFPATLAQWLPGRLTKDPLPVDKAANPLFQALRVVSEHLPSEAAPLILQALRSELDPASPRWGMVLRPRDNTLCATIFSMLRDRPPPASLGPRVAGAANSLMLEEPPRLENHPFNSSKGAALLEAWLSAPESPGAFSAAVSLAFCDREIRERLLPLALNHRDQEVAIEGAWADVRGGGTEGVARLQKLAIDEVRSVRAVDLMRELKIEDKIPPAALEPLFAARAEMIHWLSDERELGSPPKTLELYDRRTLAWPPKNEKRELFLFQFTHPGQNGAPDRTDYGLVGGNSTFALFDEHKSPPDPVDLYADHLHWELNNRDEDEDDEDEESAGTPTREAARQLLEKANPGQLKRR